MPHTTISPAVLYWATAVVLITTQNPDGTPNIAPMSSIFWVGDRAIIGLQATSQTSLNLSLSKTCVLNLPSPKNLPAILALNRTTGLTELSESQKTSGVRVVKDKFAHAGLKEERSEVVDVPRIRECPVQMECEVVGRSEAVGGFVGVWEVRVLRVHIDEELKLEGHANRVDTTKFKPVIMSFWDFFTLDEKLGTAKNSKEENVKTV